MWLVDCPACRFPGTAREVRPVCPKCASLPPDKVTATIAERKDCERRAVAAIVAAKIALDSLYLIEVGALLEQAKLWAGLARSKDIWDWIHPISRWLATVRATGWSEESLNGPIRRENPRSE